MTPKSNIVSSLSLPHLTSQDWQNESDDHSSSFLLTPNVFHTHPRKSKYDKEEINKKAD